MKNQIEFFNKLVELNDHMAVSSMQLDNDVNGIICSDALGGLKNLGFEADVDLTFTVRIKRKAYIELSDLLSNLVRE